MSEANPQSGLIFTSPLKCPICGKAKEGWSLSAEAQGAPPFEGMRFKIYICRNCGMGITDPVPSEAESHRLYESRESADFQEKDSALASRLKSFVANRDMGNFLAAAQLERASPKMLDYACGNGAFALSMRNVSPSSELWATDYHESPPPMLSGSAIRYSSYKQLLNHAPFDFILCRHVLEHTYNPVQFLSSMSALLSSGGVLMIEIPNLQAPLRKIFGKYWNLYYAPYHPIHFSSAVLRRAVSEAGLLPIHIGGCEMPMIGRSIRNVFQCAYNPFLFAIGMLLQPLQLGGRLLTKEPTCLRIWARRP